MDHSYYIDKLSAYSDMELTGEEHEVVRQHIESCPECQAILVKYEKLDQLVEKNQALDDSDYWEVTAGRIEARLSSDSGTKVTNISRQRSGWLGWKLASVAATIAFLTFVALNREDIEKELAPMSKPSVQERPIDPAWKKSNNISPSKVQKGEAQTGQLETDINHSGIELTSDDRLQTATEEIDEPKRSRLQPEAPRSTPPVVEIPAPEGVEAGVEGKVGVEYGTGHSKDQIRLTKEKNETVDVTIAKVARKPVASIDEDQFDEINQLIGSASIVADKVAPTSLEYWRQHRDSLEGGLRAKYYSRVKGEKDARSLLLSTAESSSAQARHNRDLLESYYWIGKLTQDRNEFERSLKYIRQYVNQSELTRQNPVVDWLKELEALESAKWGEER